MKVLDTVSPYIPISDLKDGQLAVIRVNTTGGYVGRVVQRYDNIIIQIGEEKGHSWTNIFKDLTPEKVKMFESTFLVQVLKKGTKLEV